MKRRKLGRGNGETGVRRLAKAAGLAVLLSFPLRSPVRAAGEFLRDSNRAAETTDPAAKTALYTRALGAWTPADGDRNKAIVLANRAALHHGAGRYEDAIADLDASMAIMGENPIAVANRGAALSRLERHAEAVGEFTKAIRMEPRNPVHYASRAVAHDAMGNTSQAILDYNVLLSIDPAFKDGFKTRGSLHFKSGEYEEAVRDFDAAIAADKGDRRAYQLRALAREAIDIREKNAAIQARSESRAATEAPARAAPRRDPEPSTGNSPANAGPDARIWLAAGGLLLLGLGLRALK
ncbi:MAG: hypothetical protein AUJ52_01640 [Elusimicrobia bacterium CG1_02_63_36]|nr:MAG: hypothetical protein AUJ52_01640 [Elusimicrobia bacterium CG1_02_63_36]PIP84894.1 MAG: hypothetical protein COR54_01670 [Elusimicrobia bacterium CG22_combo_CG10-13_8_21_14_all_63_91]PJA13393.1 MAG: hypothetical protein COX66_15035 [Elusimicrobia bacterium CG_4_10_14_0_2_um_filter_63_34]PJB25628.1 MAG: hypothetical protein CO113_07730 [Elusimicrobia bacterium CG_4_9_14_3_um_filter_62_55]